MSKLGKYEILLIFGKYKSIKYLILDCFSCVLSSHPSSWESKSKLYIMFYGYSL